jgi:hypothetical protein
MNTPKKFWLVLIGAALGLAVIACSCSSIIPTPTAGPSTGDQGPMPGLVGKWLDPDTSGTYHIIAYQNGEYVVTATNNPNKSGYKVTSSTWANGVLTWTYCVPDGACVTTKTVSVSGDNLETTWTNDQTDPSTGNPYSGTTTMTRMP